MKKRVTILFVLILFLFPIISAIQFDMKTNFSQSETFTAKISGNFTEPISEENIIFYRGHVQTSIITYVAKIDNEFYIYASLIGKIPNNYSIAIGDYSKNFTITENTADFSVNPGFIITRNNFSVEVKNLQNKEITIKTKFNKKENSIIVNSQETKKINFKIDEIEETTLEIIELSTENLKYEIPTYIFVTKTEITEEPEQNQTPENKLENKEEIIAPEPTEITSVSTTQTCEEMNGTVCDKTEKCDAESAYAKDNVCCLGTCNEIESDDGWKIAGWILIVLAVLIIFFIRKKYRGVKQNIDLLKIAKGKR